MYQLSVSPALFFNVKANTALPCLMASLRSASEDVRAELMISNASEAGKAATVYPSVGIRKMVDGVLTVLKRHCDCWRDRVEVY
jgi:hypothetical protein